MKTFKLEAIYKRPDGTTKAKALYTVEAESIDAAKTKLQDLLQLLPPDTIREVAEK